MESSRPRPWPRGASRPAGVSLALALASGAKSLALALALTPLALALALALEFVALTPSLSITEWAMYIIARGCRLRNDLYCVEWDVKPYYTIPYHTIPYLSVRFTGQFPRVPGLAGTRMSSFWISLELRVTEVVVYLARRHAKLLSKCCHQQTNTQFIYMPSRLLPYQQYQNTEGNTFQLVPENVSYCYFI